MTKSLEDLLLDFETDRSCILFLAVHKNISRLNIGLHVLETNGFQSGFQSLHFYHIVPGNIDATKKCEMGCHKLLLFKIQIYFFLIQLPNKCISKFPNKKLSSLHQIKNPFLFVSLRSKSASSASKLCSKTS